MVRQHAGPRFLPGRGLAWLAALLSSLHGTVAGSVEGAVEPNDRPNILLVVLDDVGANDLGYNGSEIRTPTLDRLAREGVVLDEFHAAPNCSPTRAMLLSGVDSHLAGLGNMAEELAPNQRGRPGYEGYLNRRVAALPELLADAGYHTYMTGKWHLGLELSNGPAARGFERSFAMLDGGAGAFDNMLPLLGPGKANYREDGRKLDALPDGFYSSRFYSEQMRRYIEQDLDDSRPFFAYLAYTAPHWPLQAPRESIERYDGVYDVGYDELRDRRLRARERLGLTDSALGVFPRLGDEPAWTSLDAAQRLREARRMEIYAAMVSDVDRYLGELLAWLDDVGELGHTAIVVLSDNGPEGHHLEIGWDALAEWVERCCDNRFENLGNADSYTWYGPNWGAAGSTPARMFKGYVSQGGVRVPALFHMPARFRAGARSKALAHVTDVMPTLLELAGVAPPGREYRGRRVYPLEGRSLLPMLEGAAEAVHPPEHFFAWELFGKRAVRQGRWKAIYLPDHELLPEFPEDVLTDRWQLFDLATDPAELHDLADLEPERLNALVAQWERYAREKGVILPDETSGY